MNHEFAVRAEHVFAAHTRGALIPRWTGPEDAPAHVEQFAARAGGRWRYVVSEQPFHGVFHEVVADRRIVRTVESDGRVALEVLTFTDLDGGRSRVDGIVDLPGRRDDYARLDALLAEGFAEAELPSIRYSGTTVDCADPQALAQFYADLTGGTVLMSYPHWAVIRTDDGEIAFQGTPGYRPPVWPDEAASIQMHLDFYVTDRAATEAHAVKLGATTYAFQPNDHCTVLADPAGHAFCLSTWGEPS
ncbi:MAG TPA: VOC family protein [Micromonosporaceae bacterium]|jgi:uncharacterized protein YndB with AHSA1/START domain